MINNYSSYLLTFPKDENRVKLEAKVRVFRIIDDVQVSVKIEKIYKQGTGGIQYKVNEELLVPKNQLSPLPVRWETATDYIVDFLYFFSIALLGSSLLAAFISSDNIILVIMKGLNFNSGEATVSFCSSVLFVIAKYIGNKQEVYW